MKICAISDNHGFLPIIEPCDILIMAGDIVPVSVQNNIFDSTKWLNNDFKDWLNTIPARDVVAVPGNHDWVFEKRLDAVPKLRWQLLIDKDATVQGVKFFGSPYQLWFWDWAFNAPEGSEGEAFLDRKFSYISSDTDVIICHGPPYGYGDTVEGRRNEKLGSKSLLKHIERVKPKLSVHGHIHTGRGIYKHNETTIVNASLLDERYSMAYTPLYFEDII